MEITKKILSIILLLLMIIFVSIRIAEDNSLLMGCGVAAEKIEQLCSSYPDHSACSDGLFLGGAE